MFSTSVSPQEPTLHYNTLPSMGAWKKEMTACQEAIESCLESKKPTSVEIKTVVVHD
jgi:hypothetical protein